MKFWDVHIEFWDVHTIFLRGRGSADWLTLDFAVYFHKDIEIK